ncbi:MAG TPA: hypothetical protein VK846_17590 [Candidatus Limnocylindria bacterium]|nr:hypothetical protein [Candidatus Limnocylindria bacterium]
MKRATITCVLLAMFGTIGVGWRQHSLFGLRKEQAGALLQNNDTNRADVPVQEEAESMHEEAMELPKLRNEVGQLRAVRTELSSARAENARLLEAKRTGAVIPRATPAGFISKAGLVNAGLATPEDALQTFFWATREGNLAVAMELMPSEDGDKERFDKLTPEDRAREESNFRNSSEGRAMSAFNDFAVAQREQISEDTVVLHIRSSVATNTFPFQLKRYGTEWKLIKVFR